MSRALYLAGKRAADIAISALSLLVLAPVFLLVGIAIKREDSGPIFFKQWRSGKGGKAIRVAKFRTMAVGDGSADALDTSSWHDGVPDDFVFKTSDFGSRNVTRVGRWLRRTSIDELPQLINVLWGDMSLVGPRPEILPIAERYSPEQARRLTVKPGLTGWAQVTGRALHNHGEKLAADLHYVDHASARLDLQILCKTIGVTVRGEDAF